MRVAKEKTADLRDSNGFVGKATAQPKEDQISCKASERKPLTRAKSQGEGNY